MPSESTIGDLVKALGAIDATELRDSIEAVGDRLRSGAVSRREDLDRIATRLKALAEHESSDVRKEVAHACEYLPKESFLAIVGRLLDDGNSWVADAARRALARRTEVPRGIDLLKLDQQDSVEGWLSELEESHGPRSRQAAVRVADSCIELLTRELHHELKKVITPIDAAVINLRRRFEALEPKPRGCRARFDTIDKWIRLLLRILESLRELTLVVVPDFRPEALREVVEEAAALVKGASRRACEVQIDIDRNMTLEGHRHRLVQAFARIIENALESYDGVARKPWLRIEARVEGELACVSFIDRGGGMSAARIAAIRPFNTDKPEGTGVGLPLAKRIVVGEHRGSLSISSVEGKGTNVTIALPLLQVSRA